MFYKTNIDITKDKQMFSFLKDHFRYPTMNSWNGEYSIANNVKLYKLNLSGKWSVALDFLNSDEYENINWMIQEWEREHPGYSVGFNGRSGGYLVLYNADNYCDILPDCITSSDDYEQYKEWCTYYNTTVKENRYILVEFTKLVRDFDRLCDELRDYCDELSNLKYEVVEMEKSVERFNSDYADDLAYLDFEELSCDEEGKVDVSQIKQLHSLWESFLKIAHREGYAVLCDNNIAYLTER